MIFAHLKHLIAVMLEMKELRRAAMVVMEVTIMDTMAWYKVELTNPSNFSPLPPLLGELLRK